MTSQILPIVLVLALSAYWNHLTFKHFENYRKRANERLARLEKAAEENGWKLSFCSFGFFTDIDSFE